MNLKSLLLAIGLMISGSSYADFQGTVIDVLDGGRVVVSTKDQLVVVKLKSIVTPFQNQNLYGQSRIIFENIFLNKNVIVSTKNQITDRCVIGEVYSQGVNLNEALLISGFAWIFNEHDALPQYFQIENYNKSNGVGLWNLDYHFEFNNIALHPEYLLDTCIANGVSDVPLADQPSLMNEINKYSWSEVLKVLIIGVFLGVLCWFGLHYYNEKGHKALRKVFPSKKNKNPKL